MNALKISKPFRNYSEREWMGEPVMVSLWKAIEGMAPWTGPVVDPTAGLADIVNHGHALMMYDGERKVARECVGCGRRVVTAWKVSPLEFTVPACSGQCVADKVQALWVEVYGDVVIVRDFGREAIIRDEALKVRERGFLEVGV